MTAQSERLILASKSAARQAMLTAAGVPFSVQVADVDEEAVKAAHDPGDATGLAVERGRRTPPTSSSVSCTSPWACR